MASDTAFKVSSLPGTLRACFFLAAMLITPAGIFVDASQSAGPPGSVRLKVDVDLVQVDAIVYDRSGKLMMGLRQEDFRIFEDGIEQKIQKLSREEQPLAIALITDGIGVDWNHALKGSKATTLTVRGPSYEFVQRLKPGDAVSLFSIIDHPSATLKMHEELTTDHQRMAEHFELPPLSRGLVGLRPLDHLHQALRYMQAAAPDRRCAVILILTTGYIDMGSNVTEKQVLKLALNTDTAIYALIADYKGDRNRTPAGVYPPWPPYLDIPGYPVHQVVRDAIPGIVRRTGGELFTFRPGELRNSDSIALGSALAGALGRLRSEGYTLSYAPANHPEGSYHSIEVRLADRFGKPSSDYTIHSRAGYYGTARPAQR